MKALIFLLLAINTQLWAANDNNIDIKKLENQKAFIGQINQCMNSDQLDQFIKKAIQKTSDQVERSKYAAILEELIKYTPHALSRVSTNQTIKIASKLKSYI